MHFTIPVASGAVRCSSVVVDLLFIALAIVCMCLFCYALLVLQSS